MVLRWLNLFLKNDGTSSPGSNLNVELSRNDDRSGSAGIFLKSGILGMLLAFDFYNTNLMSPFLGGIIEVFRGMENIAKVTDLSTQYVDLVNVLF